MFCPAIPSCRDTASYTLYKSQEDWERIRKSVEAATKMRSPFPKKKSFGSPSHRDFSVRKDQFHAWLNEGLEKALKMPIVQVSAHEQVEVSPPPPPSPYHPGTLALVKPPIHPSPPHLTPS